MRPCDLKRQQLVEKFEEIVLQEVRNHNESISVTNMTINELRDQIETLNIKFTEGLARQEASIKKLDREYESLHRLVDSRNLQASTELDVFRSDLEAIRHEVSEGISSVEKDSVNVMTFHDFQNECQITLKEMYDSIVQQKDFVHGSMYKIYEDMNRIIKEFIQEIEDRPNELWDIKADLEKKIEEAVIDSSGVLKELRVLKKEAFVMEKKIENIYMLIEKFKKKVS